MYGKITTSLHPNLFTISVELNSVYVDNSRIVDIHPSTFRNNSRLRNLDVSRNQIIFIRPSMFIHNKELNFLHLEGNNVTEINNTLFHVLEQLEDLNLSNNKIEELNPITFHDTFTSSNRYFQKVSKLKRLILARNMIRSFNFELYFPMSSNSDTYTRKFQLDYLKVIQNRLTTLDVASVKWLNQTTTVTDLTANPWNCDCSVLLEVWRGLKHKLTLHCASPRQLQGKSWDVIEEVCSQVPGDMNNENKIRSVVVSTCTGPMEECRVNTKNGGRSVVTTTLILTGVLLVGAVGCRFILAKVVKRLKRTQKTPEYCDIYSDGIILLSSFVCSSSYIAIICTVQTYADVGKSNHKPRFSRTQM